MFNMRLVLNTRTLYYRVHSHAVTQIITACLDVRLKWIRIEDSWLATTSGVCSLQCILYMNSPWMSRKQVMFHIMQTYLSIYIWSRYSFRADHSDHCYTPPFCHWFLTQKGWIICNFLDLLFTVYSFVICDFIFVCSRIDGGELFDRVIGDDFILTEKSCTVFVRQICEGIAFIHSKNVLHLDLKVK